VLLVGADLDASAPLESCQIAMRGVAKFIECLSASTRSA